MGRGSAVWLGCLTTCLSVATTGRRVVAPKVQLAKTVTTDQGQQTLQGYMASTTFDEYKDRHINIYMSILEQGIDIY